MISSTSRDNKIQGPYLMAGTESKLKQIETVKPILNPSENDQYH